MPLFAVTKLENATATKVLPSKTLWWAQLVSVGDEEQLKLPPTHPPTFSKLDLRPCSGALYNNL